MALTLIAAYDVADDMRRARLAALLQTYGDRVQQSVFILEADSDSFSELQASATKIIDAEDDSLWFLRQCAHCWEQAVCLGQAQAPSRVLYWAVL
ncbi:CRISPR-associated endonuclease Cas2 [Propionicicella superfundia]|uniref:CRISPR-associated endonuclease Cas2 n=1 Tax=Propionicicella superfundia TaxID=348582 RepID=UPI0003F89C59|nr:CRISPR-associated endonuclease Cas2 [Propionicicella superfundia]